MELFKRTIFKYEKQHHNNLMWASICKLENPNEYLPNIFDLDDCEDSQVYMYTSSIYICHSDIFGYYSKTPEIFGTIDNLKYMTALAQVKGGLSITRKKNILDPNIGIPYDNNDFDKECVNYDGPPFFKCNNPCNPTNGKYAYTCKQDPLPTMRLGGIEKSHIRGCRPCAKVVDVKMYINSKTLTKIYLSCIIQLINHYDVHIILDPITQQRFNYDVLLDIINQYINSLNSNRNNNIIKLIDSGTLSCSFILYIAKTIFKFELNDLDLTVVMSIISGIYFLRYLYNVYGNDMIDKGIVEIGKNKNQIIIGINELIELFGSASYISKNCNYILAILSGLNLTASIVTPSPKVSFFKNENIVEINTILSELYIDIEINNIEDINPFQYIE